MKEICDSSGSCMGQSADAQGRADGTVIFCSMAYQTSETRLHNPRRVCSRMQALATARQAWSRPGSAASTAKKDLEEFMLSTLPGKDVLNGNSARC